VGTAPRVCRSGERLAEQKGRGRTMCE